MQDHMNGLAGESTILSTSQPGVFGWDEPINFSTTIAAGGSGNATINLDQSYDFEVFEIGMEVWTAAASGSVPALTPLAWSPSTSDAADQNDWKFRSSILLEIRAGTLDLWNGPVPLTLCAGTIQYPRYLRVPRRIAGGTQIVSKLTNNCASIGVQGVLLLAGRRIRKA
jgi:hypothetical protein